MSPTILDARPWSLPVHGIESGELDERMRRTVFGGAQERSNRRVNRLVRAIEEKVES